MTEEVKSANADEEEIKRDSKGRVKKGHSLNPRGRPSGTKSKLNEARLVNIANKYGPYAAEQIIKIADIEFEKGNANTALKGYIKVFEEFAKMVNAQKAAELKEAGKKLTDDSDDEDEKSNDFKPVEFSPNMTVNA